MDKFKGILKKQYTYIILILLWVLAAISSPFFRTTSTFSAIFTAAVPIVLIGFSQTVVVLSGGFDLSVGAVAGFATVLCSYVMEESLVLAIIAVIAMGIAVGLINGIGITFFRIIPFIMTMGMMFVLNGLGLMLRPSPGGYISEGLKNFFTLSAGDFAYVPLLIIILAGILGSLMLNKTMLGRQIYAVGGNPKGAAMMGIRAERIKVLVFVISDVVAALAGIFIACRISSGNAESGARYLFDSFIVVFMGGTLVSGGVGGFSGTVSSALIISSLVYMLQFMDVSTWYQYIIKGLLLLIVTGAQILVQIRRDRKNA